MLLGWFGMLKDVLTMLTGGSIREAHIKSTPTYGLLKTALDMRTITDGVSGFLKMDGIGDVFYEVVNGMYEMLFPLGVAMVGTYFLLNFISTSSKESVTVESFIKSLISLVSVMAILNNMTALINKFLSLGDTLVTKIQGLFTTSTSYNSADVAVAMCDKVFGPFIKNKLFALITSNHGFQFFIFALVMWILHWVVMIGVYVAAASRLLDIGWRMAAMPIGIADVFEGGMHSNGVRYFKSFVAAVLSGGLMLLIVNIGMATSESIIVSSLDADIGTTPTLIGKLNKDSNEFKGSANNSTWQFSPDNDTITDDEDNAASFGFKVMAMAAAVQLATVGAAIGAPAKAKELMS